jgi:cytochrome c biogenesis protein CcdA
MRKLIFLLIILIPAFQQVNAQILKPVKITFEPIGSTVKVGDVVDLLFKAEIQNNWHMYTVGFDPECGPILFEVELEPNGFELAGKLIAKDDKSKYEPSFGCDARYFEHTGEFIQKIKIIKAGTLEIKGEFAGQACFDITGQCVQIAGDVSFPPITVAGTNPEIPKKTPVDKKTDKPKVAENNTIDTATLVVEPKADSASSLNSSTPTVTRKTVNWKAANKGPLLTSSTLQRDQDSSDESTFGYILLAFLLGITSLITPCVFPMIPMTVTFFLKDGQSKAQGIRTAILFGISIILIYTIAGTIFAVILGPEGLNALATHWLPNLLIFVLFIIFALSFLGLFEINAPYKLVNKTDRAAERGGYLGIFFMSATLVLVSFSCTIPLVGNVLVLASGGQIVKPILGMLAYSVAFAIPFTLCWA